MTLSSSSEPGPLHSVRLLGMPTARFIALHLHVDDLLRELEIIALGEGSSTVAVPAEVRDVTRELLSRYSETRQSAWQQAEAAQRRGGDVVDIELLVPDEAVAAAEELGHLFDRADALCRAGVLLTLPTPPELVELRRWTTSELARQIRGGAPPSPFPA